MSPRRSIPFFSGAFAGVLAVVLFSADAGAFCRTLTIAPPPGYDAVVSGCYAPSVNPVTGSGVYPLFWRNLCVGYSIQQNASKQASLYQATLLAAQAFANWTSANCGNNSAPSVSAVNENPSVCGLVEYNKTEGNVHVIAFRDDGWPYQDSSNTLGLTTLTVNTGTGEIYDADMEINTHDFTLGVGTMLEAGTGYDMLGVMTHEAGHFLGLAHSEDKFAVMYAHYTPASAPISIDDVAGICTIYPPSVTRATASGPIPAARCDATPMNGFSPVCGGGDAGVSQSSLTMECPASSTCSAAPSRPSGSRDFGAVVAGLLGLGALATRRRRRARAATALGMLLAALGGTTLGMRDARASVSIAVLFDELVSGAGAAAVVTPTEQRSAWEGGRIFTYTRVRVDRLVAGALAGDAWVKTMGGAVGEIGQIVEGEAAFAVGQPTLVFLRPDVDRTTGAVTDHFVVSMRAQGQFPVVVGGDQKPRLAGAAGVGALLAPTADRLARFLQIHPSADAARFARDVLPLRTVDDAAREITAVWAPLHAK